MYSKGANKDEFARIKQNIIYNHVPYLNDCGYKIK